MAETAWTVVGTEKATLTIEEFATVQADESRLCQVLENLFRNAIRHAGATVSVRVGLLADGTGVYVEDDGPGIPPERREQVFESGYSSIPSQTGLGLTIARRIIEAHGWTIKVGKGDAGGARFEITGMSLDRSGDTQSTP